MKKYLTHRPKGHTHVGVRSVSRQLVDCDVLTGRRGCVRIDSRKIQRRKLNQPTKKKKNCRKVRSKTLYLFRIGRKQKNQLVQITSKMSFYIESNKAVRPKSNRKIARVYALRSPGKSKAILTDC
jgi:hypothetical protein